MGWGERAREKSCYLSYVMGDGDREKLRGNVKKISEIVGIAVFVFACLGSLKGSSLTASLPGRC